MENDSTPPPLANVGLHTNRRVTETRNRRFMEPKIRVTYSSDEELFVSRPQFDKTNLTDDQEMKQEGDENLLTDDQEEPMEHMDPRLVNFMKVPSSTRWLNREFGNLEVDEAVSGKPDDMNNYMDEYCPQLKTRLLSRRFIAEELSTLCEPLPQEPEDSPILEKGLSSLNEALLQVPKDSPSEEQFPYSDKILESLMSVKRLMAIKENALLEISLKNDEIEANKDSKAWGSSQRRETKSLYQRCFATLYCVNDDLVAPMTVLHEHLKQYRKEVAEKEATACTPVEIYRNCLDKADVALLLAERYESLQLYNSDNKDLVLKFQTILNIMGQVGGPNSADLLSVVTCLFFQLSQSLPPDQSAQLKEGIDRMEPYLKLIKDVFKNVPKEEPTEDIQ